MSHLPGFPTVAVQTPLASRGVAAVAALGAAAAAAAAGAGVGAVGDGACDGDIQQDVPGDSDLDEDKSGAFIGQLMTNPCVDLINQFVIA